MQTTQRGPLNPDEPVTVARIHACGNASQLVTERVTLPPPGAGEVRIRQSTIGVNYVDIYHRTGLYPLPALPATLGIEGAGLIEAVGEDVTRFRPGERVAYAGLPPGGYAEVRNLPQSRLVHIPDDITERVAGSNILRGLTAHMLLHKVAPIGTGQVILVHSASGGLGQLLTRWAKRLGTMVIATVGSAGKIAVAEAAGADHVLLRTTSDWPNRARRLADGIGVHVAYDGIGGDVLAQTLTVVRPFGTVISLGQAGGPIRPLRVDDIGPIRSLNFSRPSVIAYTNDPEIYQHAAAELFDALKSGLANPIGAEFPLSEASRAHTELEAGRTTGSVVLTPT